MRRVLAAAVLAAALAGCTNDGGVQQPSAPQASAALNTVKDSLIAAAVKGKLTADDPDSATTLGVGVRNGVVTLRGSVRDAAARTHDVADARGVAGVSSVVDLLRVDPRGPRPGRQVADAALAARVAAAYTAAVGLQHVTVTVDRGVATLGGSVGDAATRDRVVAAARNVDGIRNVVDRIRVERP
ncbi:MAG TPA: BON domain-containing protein [Candidatus Elarobacter sp.]|jgi:osmotically-inducible protein OsmY